MCYNCFHNWNTGTDRQSGIACSKWEAAGFGRIHPNPSKPSSQESRGWNHGSVKLTDLTSAPLNTVASIISIHSFIAFMWNIMDSTGILRSRHVILLTGTPAQVLSFLTAQAFLPSLLMIIFTLNSLSLMNTLYSRWIITSAYIQMPDNRIQHD